MSVLCYIERGNGDNEAILQPATMPETYERSVDYMTRLVLGALDPDKIDDLVLTPVTPKQAERIQLTEMFRAARAVREGERYTSRYDTAAKVAETALSRGMDEQGPAPLATVHDITAIRVARQEVVLDDEAFVAGQQ
ncbi:MAG TPA: hypothetical protein VK978_02285 [Candidatus Saccharimonadales bacterium]|nr:hypothetical protein [Candidatus Saccharimonadales bacterium]